MQPLVGTVAGVGGGGGVPAWVEALRSPHGDLPDGAYDYANNRAWIGAAEVALSTVISTTAQVVPSDGIILTTSNDPVQQIGDALDLTTTANWTRVTSFTAAIGATDSGNIFVVQDDEDDNEVVAYVQSDTDPTPGSIFVDDYNAGADGRDVQTLAGVTEDVPAKVAVTRTQAKLVISLNGATIVSDTTPFADPIVLTLASYGGYFDGGVGADITIALDVFYVPQPDADLHLLSA